MENLGDDVSLLILSKFSNPRDLAQCSRVCKTWHRLCKDVPRLVVNGNHTHGIQIIEKALGAMRRLRDVEVPFTMKPTSPYTMDCNDEMVFEAKWLLNKLLPFSSTLERLVVKDCWLESLRMLWETISKQFPRLAHLELRARMRMDAPQAYTVKSTVCKNLQTLSLDIPVYSEEFRFHEILEMCPSLRKLSVVIKQNFVSWSDSMVDQFQKSEQILRSFSLESLRLEVYGYGREYFIALEQFPRLATLYITNAHISALGSGTMSRLRECALEVCTLNPVLLRELVEASHGLEYLTCECEVATKTELHALRLENTSLKHLALSFFGIEDTYTNLELKCPFLESIRLSGFGGLQMDSVHRLKVVSLRGLKRVEVIDCAEPKLQGRNNVEISLEGAGSVMDEIVSVLIGGSRIADLFFKATLSECFKSQIWMELHIRDESSGEQPSSLHLEFDSFYGMYLDGGGRLTVTFGKAAVQRKIWNVAERIKQFFPLNQGLTMTWRRAHDN